MDNQMGTHKDEEDKNGGLNNTEGEADEGAIIQEERARETREGEKEKARRETSYIYKKMIPIGNKEGGMEARAARRTGDKRANVFLVFGPVLKPSFSNFFVFPKHC